MQKLRNIPRRLNKTGNNYSGWGLFWCEFCKQEVEKPLTYKNSKSCGCAHDKLTSESKKGKKRKPFTDEHKQNMSQAITGKKRTKEQNENNSKAQKKRFKNIENHPFLGKKHTEEYKQKMSFLMMGKNNHMYGKKADKSQNWQGGKSFEPYGIEFNKELKQFIKNRDMHKCQNLNCEHKYKKLDVQHIDYDKKNNDIRNLITLCCSCHTKTNNKNNREYWTNYYNEIIRDNK